MTWHCEISCSGWSAFSSVFSSTARPHLRIRILPFIFFFFNFISNLTKKSFIFFYYIPDPVGNVHLLDGDLLIFVIYVKCWFCLLVSEWTCENRFSRLIQRIWVFFCCFSCKLKLNGLAKLVYLATIHYIKFDIRFLLNCFAYHKFILTIMTLNIYLFICSLWIQPPLAEKASAFWPQKFHTNEVNQCLHY